MPHRLLALAGKQLPSSDRHLSGEPKPCPVSIVASFSSREVERKSGYPSPEDEFGLGEEDSDTRLSMTWITQDQPPPKSFLVSSVTYMTPTSQGIAKKRAVSIPNRTSNLGFKGGAKNTNSLRTRNKIGQGSLLLGMAGQRPLSSSGAGKKKLSYNTLQLSTQSMPLIKSEQPSAKTNKLGHLLRRKQRTNDWKAHTNIKANGVY